MIKTIVAAIVLGTVAATANTLPPTPEAPVSVQH